MSTAPDQPRPPVNPRPGVVKALGICNILFAVMTGACLFASTATMIGMMSGRGAALKVQVDASAQPTQATPAGAQPTQAATAGAQPTQSTTVVAKPMIAFNPFMGMDDPRFTRFTFVDAGTGLIVNGLMFATGIGLLNLRRWGARWWTALAWVKIGRLFLLWGFYILAVAPYLSENMARNALGMIEQQTGARGRLPSVGELTRVYSIMNLIVAVSMIILGSIYPAISLWVLGRPGVKAALVDKPVTEPELP
jgi:hypothetical protein